MNGREKTKLTKIASIADELANALRELDDATDRDGGTHRTSATSSSEKNGRNTSILEDRERARADLGTSSSRSDLKSNPGRISDFIKGGRFEVAGSWFRQLAWIVVLLITVIHVVSKL